MIDQNMAKKSKLLRETLKKIPFAPLESKSDASLAAHCPGFSKASLFSIKKHWDQLLGYQSAEEMRKRESTLQTLVYLFTYLPALYVFIDFYRYFPFLSKKSIQGGGMLLRFLVNFKRMGWDLSDGPSILEMYLGLGVMGYFYQYFDRYPHSDPATLFLGKKYNVQILRNMCAFGHAFFAYCHLLYRYQKGRKAAKKISKTLFERRKKIIKKHIEALPYAYELKKTLQEQLKYPNPHGQLLTAWLVDPPIFFLMYHEKKIRSCFASPSLSWPIDRGTCRSLIKKILPLFFLLLWLPIGYDLYQGLKPCLWKLLPRGPLHFSMPFQMRDDRPPRPWVEENFPTTKSPTTPFEKFCTQTP